MWAMLLVLSFGGEAKAVREGLSKGREWEIEDYVPKGARFYWKRPVYQNLYTMNNGTFLGNDISALSHRSLELSRSGGMEGLTGWKSSKALLIPPGEKVGVWLENTDVRAFSLVPRRRWSFPEGTEAYDVLEYQGKVFEVRMQRKEGKSWESKITFRNKDFAPPGYKGAGICNSCHREAGMVVNVPGQIYRHVVWGDDGRFSWRPMDDNGVLDKNWPIEVQR